MTRRELLKLVEKSRLDKELYFKPGLDDTARTFLNSIKENLHHQRRKAKFEEYTNYKQRY